MPSSEVGSINSMELEALMREYPDWKEQFPELYEEINPPRFLKANRKDRQKHAPVMQRKQGPAPKTDYQATFIPKGSRPRSTKKPPQSPRERNPPAMRFDTNQRSDFTPKDLGVRAELIVQEENHQQADGPVEGKSQYGYDYPGHFVLPTINRHDPSIPKGNIKKTNASFSSVTTNKEHYKKWVPERNLQFGELPSFTGSILYPDRNRHLESTNMATFRGKTIPKPEQAKMAGGNLTIEGDRDFDTTNAVTYKSFDKPQAAEMVNFKGQISVLKRSKFNGESQTRSDFQNYGPGGKAKAIEPPQQVVDLRFDNRRNFVTEQMGQYKGIDTSKHRVSDPFKPEDNTYQAPDQKFETQTSQKMDYRPYDVNDVYTKPRRPPQDSKPKGAKPKLDDMTMNKHMFKQWKVEPRKQYGDFHEGHTYVPPADKFNSVSTNQDTYLGKQTKLRDSFKPEDNAIEGTGEHDFNTVYQVTFAEPGMSRKLTKQQKAALYKELKKRKDHSRSAPVLAAN